MNYTIEGELAQVANLELEKGETCWASKGSIVALDPGLTWSLKVPGGDGSLPIGDVRPQSLAWPG